MEMSKVQINKLIRKMIDENYDVRMNILIKPEKNL